MKKLSLTLALLLACVAPAQAQIAYDATGNSGIRFSGNGCDVTNNASGSNRIAFLGVFIGIDGDPNTDPAPTATYNGASMTLIDKSHVTGEFWAYMWYIVAPDTGSQTVHMSTSATTTGYCAVASFTGAAQTSPIDVSATNAGSSLTSLTITATSVTADAWGFMVVRNNFGDTNAGTNTTAIYEDDTFGFGIYRRGPMNTPGSNSMQATFGGSATTEGVMAFFCPASGCGAGGGAPTVVCNRAMLGVGCDAVTPARKEQR